MIENIIKKLKENWRRRKMIDKIKNLLFHPYDSRPFYKRILGYCNCPYHKRCWFVYPPTIHQNTAYKEERCNYITICEEFYEDEIAPYWEEMWSDYYSSKL